METAELTVEEQQKRVVGRPFEKGVSGNPNGRPKGTISLTTKLKAFLEELPKDSKKTYADLIVRKVVLMALDGDANMLKLAWNYIDGLPKFTGEMEHRIPQNLIDLLRYVQSETDNPIEGENKE